MTVYPVLMQPAIRYVCYSQSPHGGHIDDRMPDDDRCPICGGEEWAPFDVVHCPVCREWACAGDADLFRAMHGCFGGSL